MSDENIELYNLLRAQLCFNNNYYHIIIIYRYNCQNYYRTYYCVLSRNYFRNVRARNLNDMRLRDFVQPGQNPRLRR